jgi:hypothetical protein
MEKCQRRALVPVNYGNISEKISKSCILEETYHRKVLGPVTYGSISEEKRLISS